MSVSRAACRKANPRAKMSAVHRIRAVFGSQILLSMSHLRPFDGCSRSSLSLTCVLSIERTLPYTAISTHSSLGRATGLSYFALAWRAMVSAQ